MLCPSCSATNPAPARFCLHCGLRFVSAVVCATCQTLLPLHANFCFHCGAMVLSQGVPVPYTPALPPHAPPPALPPQGQTPPAPPAPPLPAAAAAARPLAEQLPTLRPFLPPPLYEPLERRPQERHLIQARDHLLALLHSAVTYLPGPVVAEPQPAGQPKGGAARGTFLFVDVSGFTPLSERLSRFGQEGAERVTTIINELFSDLVRVLFDHGGELLKFGGDALLALFPGESEGDFAASALRAVQAALAMQARMGRYAAIEAAGETQALRIKCGISSGSFFAAHIGTRENMAFVTTGHTVNRADQAEGHAEPGEVIVAESTAALLPDAVAQEPCAEGFARVLAAPPYTGDSLARPVDALPTGEVGAQLAWLAERLTRLAPYLPAELLQRIVNNPGNAQIAPDHRPVTVMFVNYEGTSTLIEELGEQHPELITLHLNRYFAAMAEIVERYEGTVARMDQYSVGDRLVVFFGAPRAHEDDPVRAVYTALEMQEATRRDFAALQTPEGIYRFRQRVGINSGHLFAGNVGATTLRQEYTLMGDDINMAARLMAKAGWREIFVSRRTQERVAPFFELKDEGALKVKGKELLIPTYSVLGRRGEIGRTRGLGEAESPLTGREEALAAVQESGTQFLAGRGGIVAIIGNSGLGKSRLTRELRAWLFEQAGKRELRWIEAQALSFGEGISHWLTAQLLQGTLALAPDHSRDDVLFALWEQGEALLGKETAREAVPFLADLLDLTLEGAWADWVRELEPSVRQKQSFWAAREFFTAFARQQPTVLSLDDLHWADEASLALIQELLSVTDRAPLFVCMNFREVRDRGCWRLRDHAASAFPHRYRQVMLGPLDDAESRALLAALLPGAEFKDDGIEKILEKAAGNPFYLEEVVRTLIENGIVEEAEPGRWTALAVEALPVPESLQGAIVARIDRLSEETRQALQMASVIGRRFEEELFDRLAGSGSEQRLWLAELERSGFIRPVRGDGEISYTFPDTLVQEVAYESLLVQRRRTFHTRIAEMLEALVGGRSETLAEQLAYHYQRGERPDKAIEFLSKAGERAQRNFANQTALERYSELIAKLTEQEAPWPERFAALERRQAVLGKLGHNDERREADLRAMLSMAEAHADTLRQARTLAHMADLFQWSSRYDQASSAARQALALLEPLNPDEPAVRAVRSSALHELGVVQYVRDNLSEAGPTLREAAALRHELGDADGEGWSQLYLCMFHFKQGYYDRALAHNDAALASATARQDWFQRGIHLTNGGRIALRLGDYETAIALLDESAEMKQRLGDTNGLAFSHWALGLAALYLDQHERAHTQLHKALGFSRQANNLRLTGQCQTALGQLALARGESERAATLLDEALATLTPLALKGETAAALSWLARTRLAQGDIPAAQQRSAEALALIGESVVEEVQTLYLNHYHILAAAGQADEAQAMLVQAQQAVEAQAARLTDDAQHARFRQQVRANRDIARLAAGS